MLSYFQYIVPSKKILLTSLIPPPLLLWIGDLMQVSYLGFSIKSVFVVMAVITLDFITGVSASVYEHRKESKGKFKMQSSRGVRSVYKMAFYIVLVASISVLEDMMNKQGLNMLGVINWSRLFLFSLIILWEYQSIGENLERRFGNKPKVFQMLDFIANLVDKFVKRSLGNILKADGNNSENKEESTESISTPEV